jgi:hypothetical protein
MQKEEARSTRRGVGRKQRPIIVGDFKIQIFHTLFQLLLLPFP